VKVVNVASQPVDTARLERALDRLADHCEAIARLTSHVEERRSVVRERLEQELGPELTHKLLSGLVAA
jgi:uncharacterized membrane protein YccC